MEESFAREWRAEVLQQAPLIAPARQFVYPRQVAGEEEALARGALQVLVHPAEGESFLGTFALGFQGAELPRGVWACPNPRELCAVAGGYAYVVDTEKPEQVTLLEMRPVVEVLPLPEAGLLVFLGQQHLAAWGEGGLAWQTARLSWEGVRIAGVEDGSLLGFGWEMQTDRELAFRVDLATGAHTGGAFAASGSVSGGLGASGSGRE
jgi:hypothetical protein